MRRFTGFRIHPNSASKLAKTNYKYSIKASYRVVVLYLFYFIQYILCIGRSSDSSVGIAIGYGVNGQGSIPGRARFFYSLWGPPRVLSIGYRGQFSRVVK
jgi:hypothetical protein